MLFVEPRASRAVQGRRPECAADVTLAVLSALLASLEPGILILYQDLAQGGMWLISKTLQLFLRIFVIEHYFR